MPGDRFDVLHGSLAQMVLRTREALGPPDGYGYRPTDRADQRTSVRADTLNDAPLSRRVDIPIIVDGDEPDVIRPFLAEVTRARLTSAAGVAGWADAIVATVDAIRQHGNADLPAQRGHR